MCHSLLALIVSLKRLNSWFSGNTFVSGAEDLKVKSQTSPNKHSAAKGSPLFHHYNTSRNELCCLGALTLKRTLPTNSLYMVCCNTANIMKDLIDLNRLKS